MREQNNASTFGQKSVNSQLLSMCSRTANLITGVLQLQQGLANIRVQKFGQSCSVFFLQTMSLFSKWGTHSVRRRDPATHAGGSGAISLRALSASGYAKGSLALQITLTDQVSS